MVCFDTSPLIWAVRRKLDEDVQPDMVTRGIVLLQQLDEQGKQVMVPSLVAAEYLQGTPPRTHSAELAVLTSKFFVASFDAACALIAAQLCNRTNWKTTQGEAERQAFKVDVGVVATAIHHKAECIYTSEVDEFRRIANGRIMIREVPQLDLYGDAAE